MPAHLMIYILLAVILAAGGTVWLLSLGGPGLLAFALPLFTIGALLLRTRRK